MGSTNAEGSASYSHTCLLIWAVKMEPYVYLWTFNRSKPFSSKSQLVGLLYSRGTSAYFFENKFIYSFILFLAALGLRCCTRAFCSCGERGLLFIVVRGLLIMVASLVAEHGL